MDWLQALILGIIQGLTEFLPVSSSGHLIIGEELLGKKIDNNIVFAIVVHCATVLSTITILRKEITALFLKFFKLQWNAETQYVCMILFSMIPVMIVGLFFKETVENFFRKDLVFVGSMLIFTAMLLLLSSLFVKRDQRDKRNVGWGSAFLVGIAQAVAVLPGLSRSGATIATGLLAGVKKEEVAKFSFLMVLIPILGETALSALKGDFSAAVSEIPTSSLVIGFLAAYVCGCLACKFMLELVKRTNLLWFALYCSVVGIGALIYALC
ncbi:MAG: undecaprenyl-diphosphate phosphatase [Bacteroidales bacterium]|jgi:undecaprenyl-diphosphatase|nr:undecaprenyl-diphosphate phosphatase [Bacteroidales bacterium]